MATIGKVRAIFTASTSGLTAGTAAAGSAMKRLQGDVSGLRSGLSLLNAISGAQLFGQLASTAMSAARSLISMGAAQAQVIDQTNLLAERLGMTYGELAGLVHAGALVDVSMETIGNAATKADVAFVKAANGSKAAIAAFEAIGLSVEELNGMTAAERFDAIAEAIAQLPTEAQRAAAAVALFGRAGAGLMPLFNQGAEGIQAAREEAERFGLTLTNAQAGNVDAMGDAFDRAQQAISGVVQQIVAYLAPAIENVTTQFSDLIGAYGGATIGQTIGDGILVGARYLAQIGDALIANLSSVWGYVSQVGGQWNAVFDFGNRVAAFLSAVGSTLQAAFNIIILGISGPVQSLISAAQQIGQALGFDTSALDSALGAMESFNLSMVDSIDASAQAAADGFNTAFFGDEEATAAGEAIAGPLTTAIDTAVAAARDAAQQVSESKPQDVEIKQKVEVSGIREAIKGLDIRSREGVAEMFRIMRGDTGNDVQERQLSVLEQIAANTADDGFDIEAVDLAPSSGGF
jgi:hypothetical protein